MRLLVPAASAALIAAMALSVTASAPAAGGAAQVSSAQVSSAGPALPSAVSTHTAGANTTRVAASRAFTWPLSPRPAVLRRFEQPRSQWSSGHRGVDLSAAVGQPVLSAGDGVVAFSGVIAGRGVITVSHSGGLPSRDSSTEILWRCWAWAGRSCCRWAEVVPHPSASRARMRLEVGTPQPLHRDVCVDLRGSQAGVAKHLLHRAKIGAALEQVGRRTVPEPVRPHIRRARHVSQHLVDNGADLSRVDSTTPSAQEQRPPTAGSNHLAAAQL